MLFLLKLILIPALIGVVSIAGRLWGAGISGWLAALPIVAGPMLLFIALEQGAGFAAEAAHNTLVGLISLSAFCLTYSWLALRTGWFFSLLAGWLAFFVLTIVFSQIWLPLALAFILAVVLLLVILKLFPKPDFQATTTTLPQVELLMRMGAAAVLVTALTAAASLLGPRLSGLLAPFPIAATVLAAFTHHFLGSVVVIQLLRGLVAGFFSFAVFFLVIALVIERCGIGLTFTLASIVTLVLHGCSFWSVKKYL